MKKFGSLILILFMSSLIHAQEKKPEPAPTAAGTFKEQSNGLEGEKSYDILDNIYDRWGNLYHIEDLIVRDAAPTNSGGGNTGGSGKIIGQGNNSVNTVTWTCAGSYFTLHFENGSGMEGTSAIELSRRAVLCQVFADLSQFINSPLTGNGGRVHIWVRDIINMGVSNPSTNQTLGLGSPFYSIPAVQNIGGIADNMIWQTVVSGTNAYTGVANPLVTNNNVYHGAISFNFANPSNIWDLTLGTAPNVNEYDFYTVALHEALHMMGFASIIDVNGDSRFGATFPYYTRYDRSLQTQAAVPLLNINPTLACGGRMYNWKWNTALNPNILAPNPGNCNGGNTNCSAAIMFGGLVVPPQHVSTPNCWAGGTSLSHFEDACAPAGQTNNMYFVMADGVGTGVMKRYPKPEEQRALCDIGYSVNSFYGNAVNLNNYTYTAPCNNAGVAGINDGIDATGAYTLVTTVGNNINTPSLIPNDRFTNMFHSQNRIICPQLVSGNGSAPTVVGNTGISYTPNQAGVHLLRYIPVDGATNRQGNITYVYIFAQSGNCIPSTCDIINNGGFESGNGCGVIPISGTPNIDCWYVLGATPDRYLRSCQSPNNIPNSYSTPPADTWDAPNPGNNAFLGLWASVFGGEGIQTNLSSNLMPNTTYVLSFWARVTNNWMTTGPAVLAFGGQTALLPANVNNSLGALPPGVTPLTQVTVSNNNQWNFYQIPFTTPSGPPMSYFSICSAKWLMSNTAYTFIDDVSIVPQGSAISFTPPATVCQFQPILNLGPYTNGPGGTFTGPGVSFNSNTGFYEFNAATPGVSQINYTTTVNGCLKSAGATVSVIANPAPVINASPLTICAGVNNTLTASGANSYTWQPTGGSANPLLVTLPPMNSTFTVTGLNSGGCTNTAAITLTPGAFIPLSSPNVTLCTDIGPCKTLTATSTFSSPVTFSWLPVNQTGSTTVVCPTVNTIYTVTATSPLACASSATLQVTTMTCCPSPTAFFALPSNTNCNASYTNLQQYVAAPNCTFSGQGVTLTGGQYDFNTAGTLQGGYYPIIATYTTAPYGCAYTFTQWVNIWQAGISYGGPILHCGYSPGSVLSATLPGATSYTWLPVNVNSPTVSVNPTVTTIYTVIAAAPGCTPSAQYQLTVHWNCCPHLSVVPSVPPSTVQAGNNTSVLNGPLVLGDLTINGPGNFTLSTGSFIMDLMTKITVKPGATLVLEDAHLYACQTLWTGIVVENGGNVISAPGPMGLPSMIEDAQTAIDIDQVGPGMATPLLNLDGVIFNKNWYGINISNSTVSHIPMLVKSCVFTYRDIPFSPPLATPSWPNSSTAPGGLRYDNNLSGTLNPPFFLGANNYPHHIYPQGFIQPIGINVQNIDVNTSGAPAGPGVDFNSWAQPNAADFNLFDHMHIGMYVNEASLTTSNNSFQYMGLMGIWHSMNSLMNARLDLNPTTSGGSASAGNRFWINQWNAQAVGMGGWPARGVCMWDVTEADIQHNLFRGSNTSGWMGVYAKTNRFHYNIKNNRFSNLNSGVSLDFYSGPFMFGVMPATGIYSMLIDISQNFFGPQVNSSTPVTTEVMSGAVNMYGPNSALWFPGANNLIQSNILDRVDWGISITEMSNLPLEISNNMINTYGTGLFMTNTQGGKVVQDNRVFCTNTTGRCMTFVDNMFPQITCNFVTGGQQGFEFYGNNPCTWMNNVMNNNVEGLRIRNGNGAIGTQGNSNLPSGNMWAGSWGAGTWETVLDPGTSAWNSILYVTPGPPSEPINNLWGSPGYAPSVGLFYASGSATLCAKPFYPPLPAPKQGIDSAQVLGISKNIELRHSAVFPNPSNGKLTIQSALESEVLQFTLIDMAGKIIYEASITTHNNTYDLILPYEAGMYMISLRNRFGDTEFTKLVIEK
ncbi:MAG: T9SS type A sorting domain-containing protein [Bacteroidia bacterium]|nr:T9SS type A sorting domain-containing protein [Bacteroidia bacterium]